jgi:hypothetical protein
MKNLVYLFFTIVNLFWGSVIAQVTSGDYIIKSALDANKNLDIMWGRDENGNGLHLWDATNGDAQQFFIKATNEAGFFNILTKWGRAIDVAGFNRNLEAKVVTYDSYPQSDNQKWQFIDAGNGYYYIKSKLGTYLDVQNANSAAGTIIWMYSFNGSNAQKWRLDSPKVIQRARWYLPMQGVLQMASVRINNFTPNRNQFNGSGERAFLKPNDSYFLMNVNGSPFKMPFNLDMVEGGPDNRCKAYINDWNSNKTSVFVFKERLGIRINFESENTELITDCFNNGCCEGNPFCPGAGCPDFELNSAQIDIRINPKLAQGRISYDSEIEFKVNVQENGNDPCTGNFWAFLCDWGLIPRQGDRQNRIRQAIETNLKNQLEHPTIRLVIEAALSKAISDAGFNPSEFKAISINRSGNLLLW